MSPVLAWTYGTSTTDGTLIRRLGVGQFAARILRIEAHVLQALIARLGVLNERLAGFALRAKSRLAAGRKHDLRALRGNLPSGVGGSSSSQLSRPGDRTGRGSVIM